MARLLVPGSLATSAGLSNRELVHTIRPSSFALSDEQMRMSRSSSSRASSRPDGDATGAPLAHEIRRMNLACDQPVLRGDAMSNEEGELADRLSCGGKSLLLAKANLSIQTNILAAPPELPRQA